MPKIIKLEMNDEKRLLDSLMTGYDRNVRPVRNASHPIVIQLGITLTQIFDMVSSGGGLGVSEACVSDYVLFPSLCATRD